MKLEVESTANFLVYLLRLADCNIKESSLRKFHDYLIEDLYRLCRRHWYPENPIKGSNYRIIRINAYATDNILVGVAKKAHVSPCTLSDNLPHLILWINPFEVTYRLGETKFVLYEYKNEKSRAWEPNVIYEKPTCCLIL